MGISEGSGIVKLSLILGNTSLTGFRRPLVSSFGGSHYVLNPNVVVGLFIKTRHFMQNLNEKLMLPDYYKSTVKKFPVMPKMSKIKYLGATFIPR